MILSEVIIYVGQFESSPEIFYLGYAKRNMTLVNVTRHECINSEEY